MDSTSLLLLMFQWKNKSLKSLHPKAFLLASTTIAPFKDLLKNPLPQNPSLRLLHLNNSRLSINSSSSSNNSTNIRCKATKLLLTFSINNNSPQPVKRAITQTVRLNTLSHHQTPLPSAHNSRGRRPLNSTSPSTRPHQLRTKKTTSPGSNNSLLRKATAVDHLAETTATKTVRDTREVFKVEIVLMVHSTDSNPFPNHFIFRRRRWPQPRSASKRRRSKRRFWSVSTWWTRRCTSEEIT